MLEISIGDLFFLVLSPSLIRMSAVFMKINTVASTLKGFASTGVILLTFLDCFRKFTKFKYVCMCTEISKRQNLVMHLLNVKYLLKHKYTFVKQYNFLWHVCTYNSVFIIYVFFSVRTFLLSPNILDAIILTLYFTNNRQMRANSADGVRGRNVSE